ncbi:MAG: SDR family NAD(P)-dependent oxidoreductase [Steroidobacteraceae bacterium]
MVPVPGSWSVWDWGQYARAQGAPPAGGPGPGAGAPGPGARPPPPPEPAFSQRAPLHDLKGKVAYITASSDGIGLGIARAASAAGMKVCIGYRNEDRLKAALPLFKAGNAGVLPIKHDVTDRGRLGESAPDHQQPVREPAPRRQQCRSQDRCPGQRGLRQGLG